MVYALIGTVKKLCFGWQTVGSSKGQICKRKNQDQPLFDYSFIGSSIFIYCQQTTIHLSRILLRAQQFNFAFWNVKTLYFYNKNSLLYPKIRIYLFQFLPHLFQLQSQLVAQLLALWTLQNLSYRMIQPALLLCRTLPSLQVPRGAMQVRFLTTASMYNNNII